MRHPHRLQFLAAHTASKGITLVEVLISLVVLSLALIGIAGLQAYATRSQAGIYDRASLSPLLNDMTARMRANLYRVPGFDAGLASTAAAYRLSDNWAAQATFPTAPSKLCGTEATAAACSAEERVTYDMWAWRRQIRDTLPQGSALVSGTVNTGLIVTVMWFDKEYRGATGLRTAETCTSAMADIAGHDVTSGQATLQQQTCCPAAAAAPAGVRCANFMVVP
jgi:type IV pilus assembly protein PilV